LHTWDIAVARDAQAVVAADAVALIVDNLEQITQRSGRAPTIQASSTCGPKTPTGGSL